MVRHIAEYMFYSNVGREMTDIMAAYKHRYKVDCQKSHLRVSNVSTGVDLIVSGDVPTKKTAWCVNCIPVISAIVSLFNTCEGKHAGQCVTLLRINQ